MNKIGLYLLFALEGLLALWSVAALSVCLPAAVYPSIWAGSAAFYYLLTALLMHPCRRCLLAWALAICMVGAWYLSLQPRMSATWSDDVARLPHSQIEGDLVTVFDVRNFNYRSETEYDIAYDNRSYRLRDLQSVDLFVSYWGSPHIAHTVLSFSFSSGSPLAFSVETRKVRGQQYSALKGFFRTFELIYIAADERDVIRLRTNYRKEEVYRYRLRPTPEQMRALLLTYLGRLNSIYRQPEFYNALTSNCTTNIFFDMKSINPLLRFDWRMLANGHLDELLYERQHASADISLTQFRERAHINSRAQAADADPQFSARIRQ